MLRYNADKMKNKPSVLIAGTDKATAATVESMDRGAGQGAGHNETPCSCPSCFSIFD